MLCGPLLCDRSKPELRELTPATPARLREAGVEIAIITDHPVIPEQYLPLCAGLAVREGLPYDEALKAITLYPARILGIADRVGSLTPGEGRGSGSIPGGSADGGGRGPRRCFCTPGAAYGKGGEQDERNIRRGDRTDGPGSVHRSQPPPSRRMEKGGVVRRRAGGATLGPGYHGDLLET